MAGTMSEALGMQGTDPLMELPEAVSGQNPALVSGEVILHS